MIEVKLISEGNVFWQDPTWIAAITGLAAIVLSFFSLRYQKVLSAFQIKSILKEKWVSELKDNVASLITCSAALNDTLGRGYTLHKIVEGGQATEEQKLEEKKAYEDFSLYKKKTFELVTKISISLDEKNKIHFGLIRELTAWSDNSRAWEKAVKENKAIEEIMKQGIEIQGRIRDATREVVNHELKEIL